MKRFAVMVLCVVAVTALVGCGSSADLSSPESAKAAMSAADKTLADRAVSELGGQEGLGASVREVTAYQGQVKVWTDLTDDDASMSTAKNMAATVLVGAADAKSVIVIAENLSPFDVWSRDQ